MAEKNPEYNKAGNFKNFKVSFCDRQAPMANRKNLIMKILSSSILNETLLFILVYKYIKTYHN